MSTWIPPKLDLDLNVTPHVIASGRPLVSNEYPENFFRMAKWCPDGSAALAQCEDRTLQVLKLPTELLESTLADIVPSSAFQQSGPILDFLWYPSANAQDPATYCFISSVRECPVKLLDATNGRLRASYKIVDHRERHVAPHSMAFNCVATHLYCGFEEAIEVFDIQRPGEGVRLATTPSRKSKDGMKGIVSSIAFSRDYSGLYAASSLTSAITLFSESTGDEPVAYLDGMTSAIMQVQFHPVQPHLLYASQRRSNTILCWDVRSPHVIMQSFERKPQNTNQKLLFDIDSSGRWLATGDEHGYVSTYDLNNDKSEPAMQFHAHDDAIGSTNFHPAEPKIMTVSGSRHFHAPSPTTSNSPSDSELETGTGSETEDVERPIVQRRPIWPLATDSSMKVWGLDTHRPAEPTESTTNE
ncbi:WD40 repeat-like protein [Rickenella mellea]|uniref:WD40 repeat-like protein n=1 Tax=Rickenella mellea TaxID=50990 RepID=A0A4Y7QJU0_9AGAM|nr:WD40 repeat-like protein [Rickenella mellea]